jgi:uncharacterized protein (TIGR03382 family)
LVTVGPAVTTLGITASLAVACALAWLLRRRIHASRQARNLQTPL